jgi:hypothetical protein
VNGAVTYTAEGIADGELERFCGGSSGDCGTKSRLPAG